VGDRVRLVNVSAAGRDSVLVNVHNAPRAVSPVRYLCSRSAGGRAKRVYARRRVSNYSLLDRRSDAARGSSMLRICGL